MRREPVYFLLIALVGALVLLYFVLRPVLNPLMLGAVLAFLFQPVYLGLIRAWGGRPSLASLATLLLVILIVLVPLALISTQMIKEVSELYQRVTQNGGATGALATVQAWLEQARALVPGATTEQINVADYLGRALSTLVQNAGAAFSGFAHLTLATLVFLMSFYFLLKDGAQLKNYFVRLSPLADADDELIVNRFKQAVSGVVKGYLLIAIIQGIVSGVGYAIFGVPAPVFWGAVTAMAALVPAVGTALILIPAIIYLFVSGTTGAAIGLLVWGAVAVGLVDNLLAPKLVSQRIKIHPLAVFLSILGGLAFFGPLGFLLGPLTMSLTLALIDIYSALKREGLATNNS